MGASLHKLTSIAKPLATPSALSGAGEIPGSLRELLSFKNGFVALEGALLVLAGTDGSDGSGLPGVREWNAPTGWRRHYPYIDEPMLFFAMDLFAGQFGISERGVSRLEVETGDLVFHARSLEEWAEKMLRDYDFETGWSIARDWQAKNGALAISERLLPLTPFVLGGDYTVDNLVSVQLDQAMELLGGLSEQVRGVPDGATLTVRNWLRA